MYDKTGLNSKFERAFVLVMENILGPSAATHYNRNSTTYIIIVTHDSVRMAEWSKARRFECLAIMEVRGSGPQLTV